jgi:glycosyltransferase involved in cell wall biosynthesis
MRILVVSQYYWPESFRINEVVEVLRKQGCEVTVLTGQPNYPGGAVYEGYKAAALRKQAYAGYVIHRVPIVPRGQRSALRLAANYLSFLVSGSLLGPWLLRGQRFDLIFVFGMSPILQILPGVVLKWLKRAPLVTWVQDLWPQSLEVTGFVTNRRVLDAVAVAVRWLYRRNDLLLVQSRGFMEEVQGMAGRTPVEYHPNPGELAFEAPSTGPAPLTLDPGFNVVFAGNMGTIQALETVVEAARLLQHEPDIRFVLVGSGSRSEWVQGEIQRLGLRNIQLPGRFQPEAMPGILAQASVLLVSLARSPIMSQTIPSKVQAYLAAGKPIIASLDGEGARVVTEAQAGLACQAEDAPALAAAVSALHAAGAVQLQQMGLNSRACYEAQFQPDQLAAQLITRLEKLLDDRKRPHSHEPARRGGRTTDDAR